MEKHFFFHGYSNLPLVVDDETAVKLHSRNVNTICTPHRVDLSWTLNSKRVKFRLHASFSLIVAPTIDIRVRNAVLYFH